MSRAIGPIDKYNAIRFGDYYREDLIKHATRISVFVVYQVGRSITINSPEISPNAATFLWKLVLVTV
jgi:hypothetical protein